jgi:sodium-dependent dicarboxylate transporter 2/3/5
MRAGRRCNLHRQGSYRAPGAIVKGIVEPHDGRVLVASMRVRLAAGLLVLGAGLAIAAVVLEWSLATRAGIIASLCLLLWLGELVPVWVPTIILWILTPILLHSFGDAFNAARVLTWSADPVLALFFGGFALAAGASRQGADVAVAALAVRLSRGEVLRLVVLIGLATAVLSMWMSNIAAAALMLGALQPMLRSDDLHDSHRRALLLSVALAADVGGIATPIGSGPNGIAMAAVADAQSISFLQWMMFGVPLTIGLLAAALVLIHWRLRSSGGVALPATAPPPTMPVGAGRLRPLGVLFLVVISLWLTETLHGVRAWVVALGAAGTLLATRLIGWRDVLRMDWATLVLIAGGIALGTLLEESGLVAAAAERLPVAGGTPTLRVLVLCLVSAVLSALMSNTATATFLIPLALSIDASPSTAILVAVACSLGVPFVISTPPNAMAVGRGLSSSELLVPGLLLMVGGCILIALTGPWVLSAMGVR